MKPMILTVLLLAFCAPFAKAQPETVTPDELGRIRVSVALWVVDHSELDGKHQGLGNMNNSVGVSVLTDERVWNEMDTTVKTPDGKHSFKLALKAYPHHNIDGTWTAIIDMTTTEIDTPAPDNTHRLWNTVTFGKFPNEVQHWFKLHDGSSAVPFVTLTVYPTRPN